MFTLRVYGRTALGSWKEVVELRQHATHEAGRLLLEQTAKRRREQGFKTEISEGRQRAGRRNPKPKRARKAKRVKAKRPSKKATRIGCTKFSKRNPSLTYGVVPSETKIREAMKGEPFSMRFGRSDAATWRRAASDRDHSSMSARELHGALQQLSSAWENGDDEAGDLASGILTVLGYEWV